MRIAVIDKSKCKPKECDYLCMRVCPPQKNEVEVFKIDEETKKPVINELTCIGCGICVKKCPFNAIKIVNLPEQLKEDPIFRYGKNGFALFRLPLVRENSIVGIIGANGLGKSTALEILAGLKKPNFGQDKELSYEEIKKRLKANELYNYFDKLEKKEIIPSYKPQFIEKIPLMFGDKTIKEVIEKYKDNPFYNELIEKLELKHLLDRKISNLSGGELQRLAILVSLLKNANVFFIDEPSSYLDIKQRLNFARTINYLREKRKDSYLIIEHDLIVLDYLSDYVHIFYGEKGVYGVVSSLRSTREGINEYLEGYLKSENIRFRDFEIKFEEKTHFVKEKPEVLIELEEEVVDLKEFKLKINPGVIYKDEIIGIVGENGIGKTTFFHYLAKKYNQLISIKEQYLNPNRDEFVFEYVGEIKDSLVKKYAKELIGNLMEKQLNQLSGGELQRVEIIKALNKEADLYLFDEPSAYLDVEQRIKVAKILREFTYLKNKTLMVIDHDLLFLDYLSDRIMVFTGEKGKQGITNGPFEVKEGMNLFLKHLGITIRRDPETKRPRINKEGSRLDSEQKAKGEYYY
ncbi:MAG: ribosome biogenesis/translation initiation ATPase RLI [Nanoarchaeota archaeon]